MKNLTAAILIAISVWGCSSQPRSVPGEKATTDSREQGTDRKQLEESLREAGERLVLAIRQGNTAGLLKLFSSEGAEIGVDNIVSHKEIQNDFASKGFIYCQFFETACFRKHLRGMRSGPPQDLYGLLPPPVSYRELLSRISGLEISVKVERLPSGKIWGQVMLGWDSPPPRDLGFLHFLNFPFSLENGEWKLGGDSGDSY